jgi:3',5'-cyclic AMP phosphodiesterase CpdA
MTTQIAHISDIHVYDAGQNIRSVFWDFVLLSGPPIAVLVALRPILEDPERRDRLTRLLFYRRGDESSLSPIKVGLAVIAGASVLSYLLYQAWRLRRIFYHRSDSAEAREALCVDLARRPPDHIVVTGDLTNVARDSEFRIGASWLRRLQAIAPVTIVPGNHDVNISRLRSSARMSRASKLDRYLEHTAFLHDGLPRGEQMYPFVRRIGDVSLVSLDSTAFNPLVNSRGAIDAEQLERTSDLLLSPELRGTQPLIAMHHHLVPQEGKRRRSHYFLELENAADLLDLVRQSRVDLLLHGHIHEPYVVRHEAAELRCAGATTDAEARTKGQIRYRVFAFDDGQWSVDERQVSAS